MTDKQQLTALIRQKAALLGFAECGIAKAEKLTEHESAFSDWLQKGFHAGMEYMSRNSEMRLNPALLLENAQSVIVLLHNYFPQQAMHDDASYRISSYAYGDDYHDVIKKKLFALVQEISTHSPDSVSRAFVDSAPILERAWAARAGLGWIGKNSMLISRRQGSYFFISEIVTTAVLDYDKPFGGNYCGDCNRCITACPTGAITDIRQIDSNKCISYLTIENKEEFISETFNGQTGNWIFGCDICQQVCPWNRFSLPHSEPAFQPVDGLFEMDKSAWENIDQEQFNLMFRHSAVKRAKFAGLKRNIKFAQSNSPH
jgi:epoxyqueuosine reductase